MKFPRYVKQHITSTQHKNKCQIQKMKITTNNKQDTETLRTPITILLPTSDTKPQEKHKQDDCNLKARTKNKHNTTKADNQ